MATPTLPPNVVCRLKETSARLATLDAAGWLKELTEVYRLSVEHDLKLADVLPGMFLYCRIGNPGEKTETMISQIGGPHASFIVNTNMPDAYIFEQFERWLEEVRKQVKPHVAKPGKRKPNAYFDGRTFANWRIVKIVEFAELLAWRATLPLSEQKKHLDAALGREIGRNCSKDVNVTMHALRKALASLPALAAQIEHEMTQSTKAREAIAARITKDIAR